MMRTYAQWVKLIAAYSGAVIGTMWNVVFWGTIWDVPHPFVWAIVDVPFLAASIFGIAYIEWEWQQQEWK